MNGPTTREPDRRTRILIADDHPLLCRGLAQIINADPDLEVCGNAPDVDGAMQQVIELQPDLVIVDISLKDSNGLDLIKRIREHDERILVLVSSMYDQTTLAPRVMRAGACGYVDKQQAPEKMLEAIHAVLDGKPYFRISPLDKPTTRNSGNYAQPTRQLPLETLSNREWIVFEAIGHGKTAKAIANNLGLSVKTVETYREHIKHKLHVPVYKH